jgi:hypothetical protein
MGKGSSKEIDVNPPPSLIAEPAENVSLLCIEDVSVTALSFPFSRLSSAQRVSLSRLFVLRDGSEIAQRLAISTPRMTSLNVVSWQLDCEAFFEALSSSSSSVCCQLKELKLSCLVRLDLLTQSFSLLERIVVLRLSNTEMTCSGLKMIVSALEQHSKCLQELNLSNNELENDAVTILKPLFPKLRRLNLCR